MSPRMSHIKIVVVNYDFIFYTKTVDDNYGFLFCIKTIVINGLNIKNETIVVI